MELRPKGTPPGVTVKLLELVAVPSRVMTLTGPVVAPTGTVAVTVPELLTVKEAKCPLNETAVTPVKFVPLIVTAAPATPLPGAKEVMAGVTVKRVVVVKGPPGVVMVTGPVVAAAGTDVVIVPEASTVKAADTPLNETAEAPVKPVIVTLVPVGPKIGENGLKLIPSRKAMTSSVAVGEIAAVLIGPTADPPGELAKKDEL